MGRIAAVYAAYLWLELQNVDTVPLVNRSYSVNILFFYLIAGIDTVEKTGMTRTLLNLYSVLGD